MLTFRPQLHRQPSQLSGQRSSIRTVQECFLFLAEGGQAECRKNDYQYGLLYAHKAETGKCALALGRSMDGWDSKCFKCSTSSIKERQESQHKDHKQAALTDSFDCIAHHLTAYTSWFIVTRPTRHMSIWQVTGTTFWLLVAHFTGTVPHLTSHAYTHVRADSGY